MVNKEYPFINGLISISATITNNYSDWCFQNRLGILPIANCLTTFGVWNSMEKTQHINILELKAIYFTQLTSQKKQKMGRFTFK